MERIEDREATKAAEVAVSCPQLFHAVLDAERGDVSVVHEVAEDSAAVRGLAKVPQMSAALAEKNQRRRLEQRAQVFERDVEIGGWIEDSRMSDHAKKLVDAGPWNPPGTDPLGQISE